MPEFLTKSKKIAMFTLTIFVLSGFFTFTSPASADFLSAYQVLKQEYSYVVDHIVAGGATEAEIEAFLVDLEAEVNSHGILTEANFNSIMYQSFEEVIQWRVHRNVFRALLESYGDEIEYTLDNSELHPSLVQIRNAVMKSLLGDEEEPPISGGGGGGGAVLTPNSEINQAISAGLDKSAAVIQVDVSIILNGFTGSLLNEGRRKGRH